MIRLLLTVLLAVFAGLSADAAPGIMLTGVLHDTDNHSYRELPFDVPAGTTKITVDVAWEDAKGTILVLGLYDPQRLRGWGGGIKPHFVVAESFASPSYLPGPISAGVWRLSLTVASIRLGQASPYTVKIAFDHGPAAQIIDDRPVRTTAGWYRGDLHTHSGQSDAQCRSLGGRPSPCPLFLTLKAAADHGLDFVVVTDHNVTSHVAELAGLAPYFDTLLVIPGREMTTQSGHYNLLGVADFVEFRLGSAKAPTINAMFDASKSTGALISINHPEIPTSEDCLGCGWNAPDTDYRRVQSIEIANGGIAAETGGFDDGPGSGVAFWEALLQRGYHLTGVGGSDNHDAIDGRRGTSPVGAQSPVGKPATVVYATSLAQPAILDAIRGGRVFIDLEGAHPDRVLDLSAVVGDGPRAVMGGTMARSKSQAINARLHITAAAGTVIDVTIDGRHYPMPGTADVATADTTINFTLPAGLDVHWFRTDVRQPNGKRVLIGNPIYIAR